MFSTFQLSWRLNSQRDKVTKQKNVFTFKVEEESSFESFDAECEIDLEESPPKKRRKISTCKSEASAKSSGSRKYPDTTIAKTENKTKCFQNRSRLLNTKSMFWLFAKSAGSCSAARRAPRKAAVVTSRRSAAPPPSELAASVSHFCGLKLTSNSNVSSKQFVSDWKIQKMFFGHVVQKRTRRRGRRKRSGPLSASSRRLSHHHHSSEFISVRADSNCTFSIYPARSRRK